MTRREFIERACLAQACGSDCNADKVRYAIELADAVEASVPGEWVNENAEAVDAVERRLGLIEQSLDAVLSELPMAGRADRSR